MVPLRLSKRPDARGFMLLEALVALFIIALLMAAMIKATTDDTRTIIVLKNKMIGSWAAENIIANVQLGIISPPSDSGIASGGTTQSIKIPMFGQTWYGVVRFQSTGQKNVWKVDVTVSPKSFKTQSVVHLITYYSRDLSHA